MKWHYVSYIRKNARTTAMNSADDYFPMSILADFSIRKKQGIYKNIYPWSDGNAQYNGGEVYYRGFSRDVIPPYPYPP